MDLRLLLSVAGCAARSAPRVTALAACWSACAHRHGQPREPQALAPKLPSPSRSANYNQALSILAELLGS